MSWKISSNSLQQDQLMVEESLFSLANGYLGVRGNFEEGYENKADSVRGTYINAFHEITEIPYGEKLYGFPSTQQKIVNIVDSQTIQLFLGEDEEPFNLFHGEVLSYERVLHLNKGYVERKIHWRSPKGIEVKLRFTRLVSFVRRELFAQRLEIEPVNFFGEIKIVSTVNGDVSNYVNDNDPRVAQGHAKLLKVVHSGTHNGYSVVECMAERSQLHTACITSHRLPGAKETTNVTETAVETVFETKLTNPLTFEKLNIYVDTLRHGNSLIEKGMDLQVDLREVTYENLLEEQTSYVQSFWSHADIVIHGDDKVQEGIRFNLYHLLQSAGRDRYSNIAAKGLSGEGYEGHYFWDTEIYMLPVFIMTKPDIAKQLLLYRYSILDRARERARELGHKKGALYPWRTISGGECSSYFPAGTAQYHISADIAYAFVQYYLATGDEAFFRDYGAEVLIETARLWIDTGHFKDGQFRIDGVTGPDEYTAIVNNNYYTNAMAKYNLEWAIKAYRFLEEKAPEALAQLKERLGIETEELKVWEEAAEKMYLPYDENLGIHLQDDSFLNKRIWDFENTPKEHYPLLLHYHPLVLYRYQVCKQPDTVLAHFLLDHEDLDTVKNSYHYYEKVTTHDSSLSTCIFSIMAAKISDMKKAYHYFIQTARTDLDNTHGNTKDGLHLANMGGTWLAITFGFAGLRIKESGLYFAPRIPEEWEGYETFLEYRGRSIQLKVDKRGITLDIKGSALEVQVFGRTYTIQETSPLYIETGKN